MIHSLPSVQPAADDGPGMNRRAVADHRVLTDVGQRIDRHVMTDSRRRLDASPGMDARPSGPLPAAQMAANGQERRHRVVDLDDGQVLTHLLRSHGKVRPDDRCRRGRPPEKPGEPLVLDERDITRSRLAHRARRADRDAPISDQSTVNQFRQLFHRCDHERFPFFPERRRGGPGGRRSSRVGSRFWSVLPRIDVFRNRESGSGPPGRFAC